MFFSVLDLEDDVESQDSEDSEREDVYSSEEDLLEDSEPEGENHADLSDEEQDGNVEGNEPIYQGAPITLHESLLAIFTLASSGQITGKILCGIFKLIALHCPVGSVWKKTLKAFRNYFKKIADAMVVYHYFCGTCVFPSKTKFSVCRKCRKGGNASFFLELPLF